MTDPGKILVVDDEAVIRDLLFEVLTDEGYFVDTAANGVAALDILKADSTIELLVTDIMMPQMDGIDLVREAKRFRPTIIPIVMTAYATLESARAAVKEGAYDYVLKPFSLSEVKLAVSNALERRTLANENARLLELTELFNISEQIATIHDERELYEYILGAALNRVGADRGSVLLAHREQSLLEIVASKGLPEEAAEQPVNMDGSISGKVVSMGEPLLVKDIQQVPEIKLMSRRLPEDSFISVPLIDKPKTNGTSGSYAGGSQVVAVINVCQKRDGKQFTEGDLKILRIIANHAAASLENIRLIHDVEASHLSTVQSMALLLEARDPYTQFHSTRVQEACVALAENMGLSQKDVETVRIGSAFHDLGKVGVPDYVLNKPGKLNDPEWELIRRHPVIGYEVLAPVHFLEPGHLEIVRGHHERLDGSGYPDGLKGDELSPALRIIGVVDSFDAMASDRAYRAALPVPAILEELERCSGALFDPKVVEILIGMVREGAVSGLGQAV